MATISDPAFRRSPFLTEVVLARAHLIEHGTALTNMIEGPTSISFLGIVVSGVGFVLNANSLRPKPRDAIAPGLPEDHQERRT